MREERLRLGLHSSVLQISRLPCGVDLPMSVINGAPPEKMKEMMDTCMQDIVQKEVICEASYLRGHVWFLPEASLHQPAINYKRGASGIF